MENKISAAIQINLTPGTKELQESRGDLILVTHNSISLGQMYWLLIFSDNFIIFFFFFFAANVYNSTPNLLVWENVPVYSEAGSQQISGFLGCPLIGPNVNN